MLIFIGLGLYNEYGLSLEGLKELRKADEVYIELYTTYLSGINLRNLENLCKKKIYVLKRHDLEGDNYLFLIDKAKTKRIALLVGGDPFAATTHIQIRVNAFKYRVKCKIIHAASIFSAAASLCGLMHYRFGRSVTITFSYSETPYNVLLNNLRNNLHTLFLLDMDVESNKYMTVTEGINKLLQMEESICNKHILNNLITVCCAQVGSRNPKIIANTTKYLFFSRKANPPPPCSLIIPASLHFIEKEALKTIANVSNLALKKHQNTVRKLKQTIL